MTAVFEQIKRALAINTIRKFAALSSSLSLNEEDVEIMF